MTESIAVTGASGTLGSVVRKELKNDYELSLFDVTPEMLDLENGYQVNLATDTNELPNLLRGHHAVVHMAWNLDENYNTDTAKYENREMFENIYTASIRADVDRVLLASSIHAIDMGAIFTSEPYRSIARGEKPGSELSDDRKIGFDGPSPASLYGWSKLLMEYRGQKYANDGLNVICARFGGVHPKDEPDYPGAHRPVNYYPSVYCSHNDLGRLVDHVVQMDGAEFDDSFHLVYGVSDNTRRVHTTANTLGWQPVDNSEDRLDDYWDPQEE